MPARILLVFAHPDDESFVAAGLSRRYADAGAEIALVTATRGEAGSCGDPPLLRHHRPHVVVTYDPQGGHGHADHVAISRFTTDAISAASDAR